MKLLILLALVCATQAQYMSDFQWNPYRTWNPYRSYIEHERVKDSEFGYRTKDQARHEYRDAYGNVVGAYSYMSPDGKLIHRKYSAAADGFKQKGEHFMPGMERTEYIQHMPVQYTEPMSYRTYLGLEAQKVAIDKKVYRKVGDEMTRKKRDIDEDDLMYYGVMPYRGLYDSAVMPYRGLYDTSMYYNAPINYWNMPAMRYNTGRTMYYLDDDKKRKKREAGNFAYKVSTKDMDQFHKQNNYDKITAVNSYTTPMVYRRTLPIVRSSISDYDMLNNYNYRTYQPNYNYRAYQPWYYV